MASDFRARIPEIRRQSPGTSISIDNR